MFVGCSTSQQHASVSQGRICTDNFTCCHTEIEAADPTFYLTQSQYTDTVPTSPSADLILPGARQASHWSANFEVTGMTRPGDKSLVQAGFEPRIFRSRGGRLNHLATEAVEEKMTMTTMPTYSPPANQQQEQKARVAFPVSLSAPVPLSAILRLNSCSLPLAPTGRSGSC